MRISFSRPFLLLATNSQKAQIWHSDVYEGSDTCNPSLLVNYNTHTMVVYRAAFSPHTTRQFSGTTLFLMNLEYRPTHWQVG